MPVRYRQVRRLVRDDGWILVKQVGSHEQYKHPTKPGRVTIAGNDACDVPIDTLKSILAQAQIEVDF